MQLIKHKFLDLYIVSTQKSSTRLKIALLLKSTYYAHSNIKLSKQVEELQNLSYLFASSSFTNS